MPTLLDFTVVIALVLPVLFWLKARQHASAQRAIDRRLAQRFADERHRRQGDRAW